MSAGTVQVMPGLPTDNNTSAQGPSSLGRLGQRYVYLGASSDGNYYKGAEFVLVKNNDGSALTAFQAVSWVDPTPGTSTVTATTAARDPNLAGVVQSAIPAGGFGYVCVHGTSEAVAAAAVTALANIEIDGTDGRWDDSAADAADMNHAFAIDTGVADTQFTIYIREI